MPLTVTVTGRLFGAASVAVNGVGVGSSRQMPASLGSEMASRIDGVVEAAVLVAVVTPMSVVVAVAIAQASGATTVPENE